MYTSFIEFKFMGRDQFFRDTGLIRIRNQFGNLYDHYNNLDDPYAPAIVPLLNHAYNFVLVPENQRLSELLEEASAIADIYDLLAEGSDEASRDERLFYETVMSYCFDGLKYFLDEIKTKKPKALDPLDKEALSTLQTLLQTRLESLPKPQERALPTQDAALAK